MNNLVYGFGINDADYTVQHKVNGRVEFCPFYQKWQNMLQRCYSKKFHVKYQTYIGCIVTDEWIYFSNFKNWMQEQNWEGKELDKDILFPGNKTYSPETCVFVDRATNQILSNTQCSKGKLSTGVCWDKERKKFKAQVKDGHGHLKYIGRFDTEKEAESAYLKNKSLLVIGAALRQEDRRVFLALLRAAKDMRSRISE